jgi:hypothetical protein
MEVTGVVAIGDEIFAEVPERADLALRKLGRPTHHEPAGDFPGERDLHVASIPPA